MGEYGDAALGSIHDPGLNVFCLAPPAAADLVQLALLFPPRAVGDLREIYARPVHEAGELRVISDRVPLASVVFHPCAGQSHVRGAPDTRADVLVVQ